MYVDGGAVELSGELSNNDGRVISGGGELTLGQLPTSAHAHERYNASNAFLGELGFVNIWRRVMTKQEVTSVFTDCIYSACGDVVEWSDFRSGTHGPIRMRWPSEIFGNFVLF